MPDIILKARWIAPIDRPLIENGAVAISDDQIVGVGNAADIIAAHPQAAIHDYESSIILPGLVNAHTHLELSNCIAGDDPNGSFADWILSVRSRMKLNESDPAETIIPATKNGIAQCVRFGVTCVGDISNFVELTRPVLRDFPLRAVSFGEVLGLAKLRSRFDSRLETASDASMRSDRLRIGISPHAPYTVDLDGFKRCLSVAKEKHLPLATHLAETPEESDFLHNQLGPFRDVWEKLGLWEDGVVTYRDSPIRFADAIGLLEYSTLLAHVNYCSDEELALLARGHASVVYCPRTHRYFGHAPHRWREMIAHGVNVAIGTDSCASSPDLNLLDDLRLVRELAPEVRVEALWEIATINGARALMLEEQIGTLTVGKKADLVVYQTRSNEPLSEILDEGLGPEETWIDGNLLTPSPPGRGD